MSLLVGLSGALNKDALLNLPAVGVLSTAYIGELAGVAAQVSHTLQVLGTVVGTKAEALVGAPYQFLLVVSAFEVCCDGGLPLLGSNLGEFRKQLLYIICHNFELLLVV